MQFVNPLIFCKTTLEKDREREIIQDERQSESEGGGIEKENEREIERRERREDRREEKNREKKRKKKRREEEKREICIFSLFYFS